MDKGIFTAVAACLLLAAPLAPDAAVDPGGSSPEGRFPGGWTVKRWGVEDGLPVNSVNDLVQDDEGYLWLATMDGLVRFDGIEFEIFDASSHPGMISNRIVVLEKGTGDALWIASTDGRLLRLVDGRITTMDLTLGLPHRRVTALQRADGRMWAGTEAGAAWWDGARFQALDPAGWSEATSAIAGDDAGRVWLGSHNGRLARFANGRLERLPSVGGRIWMLLDDPDHGMWIAHDAGLAIWRDGGYQPLPGPLAALNDGVVRIDKTRSGSLYLHVAETLYRYDGESLEALATRRNTSGRERLALDWPGRGEFHVRGTRVLMQGDTEIWRANAPINPLLIDHEDNLWVATSGDGLYRLRANPFVTFASQPELGAWPAYPIVADSGGRLWVGTSGNGFMIIGPDGRVGPGASNGERIKVVYALLPPGSADARAWVGGLGLFHLHDGVLGQEGIPDHLRAAEVRALFRDHADRVWAGTAQRGLWRLDAGTWTRVRLPASLVPARVRVFAQDEQGGDSNNGARTLWMGTNGAGVIRLQNGRFTRIGSEQGLASPLVRALFLDRNGRLWIGTENRGLCRIANPTGALSQLDVTCMDRRQGLFDDGIHQMLADGRGNLWMSCNQGIFRVAIEALNAVLDGRRARVRSTLFTEADGLPNREANGGVHSAGTVAPNGRLWFPTMAGPVVIDPGHLPVSQSVAAVIEQVGTRDGIFEAANDRLVLPVGSRDLTMHYAAPTFVDPAHQQFEYRLVGYDGQWRPAGFRRQIDFTNLPHGDYRFEVRALVKGGGPGRVAGVDLSLPPRLVETNGFRAGVVAMAALLLLAAWRWRELNMRRNRARLERLVDDRTRALSEEKTESERARDQITRQAERLRALDEQKRAFFANISHELRTPLTLLLGPLESADRAPERLLGQIPMMRRNARRLNRLVEQLLDLQHIEAGQLTIDPELHDLGHWAVRLAELFRPLSRREDIEIEIDIPADGVLAWFDAPQMEKVLGNLLSNAIKYCRPGDRIELRVENDEHDAIIRVADTGPGIAPEHLPHLFDRFYRAEIPGSPIEGTGIGLALARDLALLHGGDLTVESSPGKGSCFTIRWPAQAQPGHLPDASAPGAAVAVRRAATPGRNTRPGDETVERKQVLLVDDNPDLCAWLHHEFRTDFHIVTAEDGEHALERMHESLPDLVITDWMMPRLDGVALIRRMRAEPILADIPVILLSARADIDDQLDGLEAGAVAYVRKPFNLDLLHAQVDSVLDLQLRLRRSLAEQASARSESATPSASPWVRQVDEKIAANLHNPDFDVRQLADELAMSRATMFRKIKEETGQTPSDLLRNARLSSAHELLQNNSGSVSEVAYAVGFNSVDGFTRAYKRCYGELPSVDRAASVGSSATTD